MKRRRVLAALGTSTAALAGCLSDGDDDADPNEENGDSRGETAPDGEAETTPDEQPRETEEDGTEEDETDEEDEREDHEPKSVVTNFDEAPTRPECEVNSETITCEGRDGEQEEFETASTESYPDPPDTFQQEALFEYIETFDHAYRSQETLCEDATASDVVEFFFTVESRESFDWYDGIEILVLYRIAAPTTWVSVSDGECTQSVAFVAPTSVVYAVDETGVARVEYPESTPDDPEFEADAPDPLDEGTLVATFDK